MDNKELLKKADWAVSDLEANGGKLNAEQSNTFIRKMIKAPTLLNQIRTVPMASPERKINKIGFSSRILNAGQSNTPLTEGQRSKPATEQVTLSSKEVVAEVNLPYDVVEDVIEQAALGQYDEGGAPSMSGQIKDTIMDLIAERAALDFEELLLLGDSASGDPYLALFDGWLKLANVNVVNNASTGISNKMFSNGVKALPQQYLRNRNAMRQFVGVDREIDYREVLGNRETALGDSQFAGTAPVFGGGVRVESASLMPTDAGILTYPQNLIAGIQRDMTIETDKDIRGRNYIIVVTMRVACNLEEAEAVTKYTNIGDIA
jgi:hypothetical protein